MAPAAPQNLPLSPTFCFTPNALSSFLRLSRTALDDSITQNLNALSTPSTAPFSTTARAPYATRPPQDPTPYIAFTRTTLFPAWAAREELLEYCAHVASAPDPDDPEAVSRQVDEASAKARVVDERLDPYSARWEGREPRTVELARVVRNERVVEGIVRERSWGVLKERAVVKGGWVQGFGEWQREKASRES